MTKPSKTSELDIARDMWHDWVQAERVVMTGQEYRIGSRSLRRADLREIGERIRYWKTELAKLEGKGRNRVRQVIIRDI